MKYDTVPLEMDERMLAPLRKIAIAQMRERLDNISLQILIERKIKTHHDLSIAIGDAYINHLVVSLVNTILEEKQDENVTPELVDKTDEVNTEERKDAS